MKSYLLSFLIGLIIYYAMIFDEKYLKKTNKEVSPKYALLATLITWVIFTFIYNDNNDINVYTDYNAMNDLNRFNNVF